MLDLKGWVVREANQSKNSRENYVTTTASITLARNDGVQTDYSPVDRGNDVRPKQIIQINVSHSVAAMKLDRDARLS